MSRVTALMLTYNRIELSKRAISCFLNQTFEDKSLLIVNSGNYSYKALLHEYINSLNDKAKSLVKVVDYTRNTTDTLGDLRNVGLENIGDSSGYITTWDDDDICSNDRIEYQMQKLIENKADAVSLNCFTLEGLYTNHSFKLSMVNNIGLEPTILFKNPKGDLWYINTDNGEDTIFNKNLVSELKYKLHVCNNNDRCDIYTYVYHKNNVCSFAHFQNIVRYANTV